VRALIIIGLLVTTAILSSAQSELPDSVEVKNKVEYFFYFQSGMMVGCNECGKGKEITFSGATVHGIKLGKRLRIGGGLGYDSYYNISTVPVFSSASWDLFAKKNAFFLQFNYGGALKVWKYSEYDEYGYQKSNGGRMVNPMVGYRIRYHDASIALMLGYKFQNIKSYYEYENYVWNPATQSYLTEPIGSSEKRSINRFLVSLAVGWK
jgi:hypothetical protein